MSMRSLVLKQRVIVDAVLFCGRAASPVLRSRRRANGTTSGALSAVHMWPLTCANAHAASLSRFRFWALAREASVEAFLQSSQGISRARWCRL